MSFGISNAYWKIAAKNDDYARIVFFRGSITVGFIGLIWLGIHFFFPDQNLLIHTENVTITDFLLLLLLCFISSLGLVFYLLSLKYAPVSVSVPLSSVNIFKIVTAVFFLGEIFHFIYFISFLLAGIGIWLIRAAGLQTVRGWNKGAVYALLSSLFWGITYALFKLPAKAFGAVPLSFILESCVVITAFIWHQITAGQKQPLFSISSLQIKHYFVLALLLLGGTLFYNLAIQLIDVLYLNIIGNSTLIISVGLGIWWHQEKLSLQQFIGLLLILLSVLLVQFK